MKDRRAEDMVIQYLAIAGQKILTIWRFDIVQISIFYYWIYTNLDPGLLFLVKLATCFLVA